MKKIQLTTLMVFVFATGCQGVVAPPDDALSAPMEILYRCDRYPATLPKRFPAMNMLEFRGDHGDVRFSHHVSGDISSISMFEVDNPPLSDNREEAISFSEEFFKDWQELMGFDLGKLEVMDYTFELGRNHLGEYSLHRLSYQRDFADMRVLNPQRFEVLFMDNQQVSVRSGIIRLPKRFYLCEYYDAERLKAKHIGNTVRAGECSQPQSSVFMHDDGIEIVETGLYIHSRSFFGHPINDVTYRWAHKTKFKIRELENRSNTYYYFDTGTGELLHSEDECP